MCKEYCDDEGNIERDEWWFCEFMYLWMDSSGIASSIHSRARMTLAPCLFCCASELGWVEEVEIGLKLCNVAATNDVTLNSGGRGVQGKKIWGMQRVDSEKMTKNSFPSCYYYHHPRLIELLSDFIRASQSQHLLHFFFFVVYFSNHGATAIIIIILGIQFLSSGGLLSLYYIYLFSAGFGTFTGLFLLFPWRQMDDGCAFFVAPIQCH